MKYCRGVNIFNFPKTCASIVNMKTGQVDREVIEIDFFLLFNLWNGWFVSLFFSLSKLLLSLHMLDDLQMCDRFKSYKIQVKYIKLCKKSMSTSHSVELIYSRYSQSEYFCLFIMKNNLRTGASISAIATSHDTIIMHVLGP